MARAGTGCPLFDPIRDTAHPHAVTELVPPMEYTLPVRRTASGEDIPLSQHIRRIRRISIAFSFSKRNAFSCIRDMLAFKSAKVWGF